MSASSNRSDIICGLVNGVSGLIFGTAAVGLNAGLGPLYKCQFGLAESSGAHTWQLAALLASVNVGCMIGSILGGSLSKTFGIRAGMIVAALFSMVTVPSMFAGSYGLAFGLRIATGLGVGIAGSVSNAFVSVSASARRRGALGACYQLFITIGIFIASVVCYFSLGSHKDDDADVYCDHHSKSDIHRRIAFVYIPGAVSSALFLLLSFMPDLSTPGSAGVSAWFRRMGYGDKGADEERQALASSALSTVPQGAATGSDLEVGAVNAVIEEEESSWGEVLSERRALVVAIVGAIGLQLSGINAVMFFCGDFLKQGDVSQISLGNTIIMGWNCITTFLGPLLLERLGRRKLFIGSMAVVSVSMVVLTVVDLSMGKGSAKAALVFILLALYILAFEVGPGCCFWVIASEVFSARSTAKGFSLLNMLQWGLTLAVTLAFLPMQEAIGEYSFLIFGAVAMLVTIFFFFFFPETRGKSKAELQALFADRQWLVFGRKEPEF
eukprot:TRINITY_DN22782_c0_g1_i1.p1 TRINITY_DN22782_c0_g1~~TRINITY_DN22782_c0_g1_i1.p1  ORF type:complete len:554 (-),score=111.65 TRINITY_DN22782_c0_g1_i1:1828-3315(-)